MYIRKLFLYLIVIVTSYYSSPSEAELVVSHHGWDLYLKNGNHYEIQLILLSLDKTKDLYGPYRIKSIPWDMTHSRAIEIMRKNKYTNQIRSLGYEARLSQVKELKAIRFPLYRGLLGYRTCFASNDVLGLLPSVNSLDDFSRYSQGAGVGWTDVKILRHNGFRVIEVSQLNRIYKMLSLGRIDLFCRGATEVVAEQLQYGNNKIGYDRSLALYYPMPIFLYTHKDNTELHRRLTVGIQIAYDDGSMEKLWKENFGGFLDFVNLEERTIFEIENPLVDDIEWDYKKYLYDIPSRASSK